MKKNKTQAGKEMDVLIAKHVFEYEVLGETTCVYVEGEWDIYPESKPENWGGLAWTRSVYLHQCHCLKEQEPDEDEYYERNCFGHQVICCRVVPPYSADIRSAWKVIEYEVNHGAYAAVVFDDDGHWALVTEGMQPVQPAKNAEPALFTHVIESDLWCDTVPHAICYGFLKDWLDEEEV